MINKFLKLFNLKLVWIEEKRIAETMSLKDMIADVESDESIPLDGMSVDVTSDPSNPTELVDTPKYREHKLTIHFIRGDSLTWTNKTQPPSIFFPWKDFYT